jgi:hypothetical protein
MFCTPGLVFGGTEGVGSRFHVLRARTRFRWYRGRRVPFSCFARPDSFSAVPRATCPVLMFCAPGIVFDRTEGVVSRFHDLRARPRFQQYRGRRILFLCFALPDSFSAVARASGPVFMLCAPELIFGGNEVVGFLFSCFALPDSFSAIPRASGPVFMFCVPELVFQRYRGRRVPFSCFTRPNSFSGVTRLSCPIFMFYAPELVFGDNEGVGSRFHVLGAPTRFRRYRGRRVPFSCLARPGSFSAVTRASSPVFMFCAPVLDFDGT